MHSSRPRARRSRSKSNILLAKEHILIFQEITLQLQEIPLGHLLITIGTFLIQWTYPYILVLARRVLGTNGYLVFVLPAVLGGALNHAVLKCMFPWRTRLQPEAPTPNLPTKIIPTKIARLKLSGRFPIDMKFPPLTIKILLESDPLKSRILVRRLAVTNVASTRRGKEHARSTCVESCSVESYHLLPRLVHTTLGTSSYEWIRSP